MSKAISAVMVLCTVVMVIGFNMEMPLVTTFGVFGIATILSYFLLGRSAIVVGEHDTIVVKDWLQKRFTRVLLPGESWLKLTEEVAHHLSTLPFQSNWTVSIIKSADGLPHEVDLSSNVQINVSLIDGELLSTFVEFLEKGAGAIAKSHISDCLREVCSFYSADYLNDARNFIQLKQELTQRASARLKVFGLQLFSIHIGAIRPPAAYQEALIRRRERELATEARMQAWREARDFLASIPSEDKEILVNLEQLVEVGRSEGNQFVHINHSRQHRTRDSAEIIDGEYYIPNDPFSASRHGRVAGD